MSTYNALVVVVLPVAFLVLTFDALCLKTKRRNDSGTRFGCQHLLFYASKLGERMIQARPIVLSPVHFTLKRL